MLASLTCRALPWSTCGPCRHDRVLDGRHSLRSPTLILSCLYTSRVVFSYLMWRVWHRTQSSRSTFNSPSHRLQSNVTRGDIRVINNAPIAPGVLSDIFNLTCRPSYALYTVLRIGNIETVLASSTAALSWVALVASGTMWYGSASNPTECFGPTRYMWDLGLYLESQLKCLV
jgi:hypothetical protein